MDERIKSTAVKHPALVYTTSATVLALAALSPAPSFVPLVALLACMRLTAYTFLPRPSGYIFGVMQAGFIALAAAAMHLAPSMDALSTPNTSLVVIGAITFFMSGFASAVVFAGTYATRLTHQTWTQLTVFPALWASAWGSMSSVSPVGQLVTWSPVVGLGPYNWLRSILGQWGIDWVTAAWAVVFSEVAGAWVVGKADEVDEPSTDQQPLLVDYDGFNNYHSVESTAGTPRKNTDAATRRSARNRGVIFLTTVLLFLAVPSYTYSYLPLPINSHDTTPLTVACIMPPRPVGISLTFDHYLKESVREQSLAKTPILVWPEGAVSFSSPAEKNVSFTKIFETIQPGRLIGVSFEEVIPPVGSTPASKQNGFALLDTSARTVRFEYYKRNLVPGGSLFHWILS